MHRQRAAARRDAAELVDIESRLAPFIPRSVDDVEEAADDSLGLMADERDLGVPSPA